MNEEFAKLDAAFKKASADKKLAAYLVRLVDGASASVKNMDAIAAGLYAIGTQQGKTEDEIKMEYQGFAAGLIMNKTVAELESEKKSA